VPSGAWGMGATIMDQMHLNLSRRTLIKSSFISGALAGIPGFAATIESKYSYSQIR
jgi:hypothetical protein